VWPPARVRSRKCVRYKYYGMGRGTVYAGHNMPLEQALSRALMAEGRLEVCKFKKGDSQNNKRCGYNAPKSPGGGGGDSST